MAKLITQFGVYEMDVVTESEGKSAVILPSYPTEQGVEINDHRIVVPNEYRMSGIVTTVPMGFTIESFISRLTSITSTRPNTFLQALFFLKANASPFTVVSRYTTLNNMMISEITYRHTGDQDLSLSFDVKLQEFITVSRLIGQGEPIVSMLPVGDVVQSAISATVQTGEILTRQSMRVVTDQANRILNLL